MPTPATTGVLRNNISDMEIGDYIIAYGWSGSATNASDPPHFNNLGTFEGTELSISGSSPAIQGAFYFVKVAKGLLVGDRIIRHSVTWDHLNSCKVIQGVPVSLNNGSITGIKRSLTGGVAYADLSGNKSLTDQGFGAFPTNNEWDKYIVNFPSELIQSGKTVDDVFHWKECQTWCQETPVNGLTGEHVFHATPSARIRRGNPKAYNNSNYPITSVSPTLSSQSYNYMGYRPVFEYTED